MSNPVLKVLSLLGLALGGVLPQASARETQVCPPQQGTPVRMSVAAWDGGMCGVIRNHAQKLATTLATYDQNDGSSSSNRFVSSKSQSVVYGLLREAQNQNLILKSGGFFTETAAKEMSSGSRIIERTYTTTVRKKKEVHKEVIFTFPVFQGSGSDKEQKEAYKARRFQTDWVQFKVDCSEDEDKKTCVLKSLQLGKEIGAGRSFCPAVANIRVEIPKKKKSSGWSFGGSRPTVQSGGGLKGAYAGVQMNVGGQTLKIPRSGDVGYADWKPPFRGPEVFKQPVGSRVSVDGLTMYAGGATEFGGYADRGVSKSEKAAFTGERLRSLSGHYCALRADMGRNNEIRDYWKRRKILVVDPATKRGVVCEVKDWGPNPARRATRGDLIDLSPQTMAALRGDTSSASYKGRSMSNVAISFAAPNAPLGPVR